MLKALSIAGQVLRLWWREFFSLTVFNIAWLALQIPIVTGPPATAAMYVIARRVVDDEFVEFRHGWGALREMFFPAWKWGAINLLIIITIVGNLWLYQAATGFGWTILRLVWGTIGLAWFAISFFYWPFWLAQKDRSLRTTLRNGFLFLAKRPGFAITLVLISAVIIVVSVLVTVPLATVLMAWLALIGILAVDDELKRMR